MTTLTAYRVAPNTERKARDELHQHGIKARLPRERDCKGRTPIARGYIFSDYKPAFAKHVKSRVGAVSAADLLRLYPKRQKPAVPVRAYPDGASVAITRGHAIISAIVTGYRDRTYFVEFEMLGKTQRQAIHEMHVKPGSP